MVYTIAGNGIVLSIHFCMGDYSGISFEKIDSPTCGKCGMKDREGCCHDEVQVIKFDSPVTQSASFIYGLKVDSLFQSNDFSFQGNDYKCLLRSKPSILPLFFNGPPLHLLNCNFRI
jgi:hypothetical protein